MFTSQFYLMITFHQLYVFCSDQYLDWYLPVLALDLVVLVVADDLIAAAADGLEDAAAVGRVAAAADGRIAAAVDKPCCCREICGMIQLWALSSSPMKEPPLSRPLGLTEPLTSPLSPNLSSNLSVLLLSRI